MQVHPALAPKSLPLGEVTRSLDLQWEDPVLTRWDRHPQIAVQAGSTNGTFMTLRADVAEHVESMALPPGYSLFWAGEYKNIVEALLFLVPGMLPAALIMALIIVALFNAVCPVVLAALTAVLGVAPLLDVFGVFLAIAIMAGLTVGTLIAMVLMPTLYAVFYRIPSPKRASAAATTPTIPNTD